MTSCTIIEEDLNGLCWLLEVEIVKIEMLYRIIFFKIRRSFRGRRVNIELIYHKFVKIPRKSANISLHFLKVTFLELRYAFFQWIFERKFRARQKLGIFYFVYLSLEVKFWRLPLLLLPCGIFSLYLISISLLSTVNNKALELISFISSRTMLQSFSLYLPFF